MSLFIKTEHFTLKTKRLDSNKRKGYLLEHISWVNTLKSSGRKICSGYLVNDQCEPGGGGLLILEAKDYKEAKVIILSDPMIKNNLVTWDLKEWLPIQGNFLTIN